MMGSGDDVPRANRRLVAHANVGNSCLRLIRRLGYVLTLESDNPEADLLECFWVARRSGTEVIAGTPLELLALVTVAEAADPTAKEPYWWVVPGSDIVEELAEQRWPED